MTNSLVINWQNAPVLPDKRIRVELAIRDRMIDLCGDFQTAKRYYDAPDRKRNPQSPYNLRFEQAILDVTRELDIPPTCRQQMHIVARFE